MMWDERRFWDGCLDIHDALAIYLCLHMSATPWSSNYGRRWVVRWGFGGVFSRLPLVGKGLAGRGWSWGYFVFVVVAPGGLMSEMINGGL